MQGAAWSGRVASGTNEMMKYGPGSSEVLKTYWRPKHEKAV